MHSSSTKTITNSHVKQSAPNDLYELTAVSLIIQSHPLARTTKTHPHTPSALLTPTTESNAVYAAIDSQLFMLYSYMLHVQRNRCLSFLPLCNTRRSKDAGICFTADDEELIKKYVVTVAECVGTTYSRILFIEQYTTEIFVELHFFYRHIASNRN